MSSFSLTAVFGMDASGVRSELKTLRKDISDFGSEIGRWGAAAAVGAFMAFSKSALDLAGRITDVSDSLGVNAMALQALEAQHKLNGVSEREFTAALTKTKAAALAAAEGDEKVIAQLTKLGIKTREFIGLPLEKQYEAIATGATNAKNANEGYAAVSALMGEKVGPKLMASLRELASEGLPGVMESASKAGKVMNDQTRKALDDAGDAIEDFKTKATIAVGNILVNFKSEEGLKLLWLQLSDIVLGFGAKMVDAVTYPGRVASNVFAAAFGGVVDMFRNGLLSVVQVVAEKINAVLPNDWKINIAGIEALKVASVDVGDRITRAIANTNPAALTESLGAATSAMVREQQAVVDAANAINFGPEADKIRQAGIDAGRAISGSVDQFKAGVDAKIKDFFKELDATSSTKLGGTPPKPSKPDKPGAGGNSPVGSTQTGPQKTGDALVDEYTKKAWDATARGDHAEVNRLSAELSRLKEAATDYLGNFMGSLMSGMIPSLEHIATASDEALREIVRRSERRIADIHASPASAAEMASGRFGRKVEAVPYDMERAAALRELELRGKVRGAFEAGGPQAVFNALPNIAPVTLDRLIKEFASQAPLLERSTLATEELVKGLRRTGLLGR